MLHYLESEEKLTWVNAFFPLVCYYGTGFGIIPASHSHPLYRKGFDENE
jgi:hypothetical protein